MDPEVDDHQPYSATDCPRYVYYHVESAVAYPSYADNVATMRPTLQFIKSPVQAKKHALQESSPVMTEDPVLAFMMVVGVGQEHVDECSQDRSQSLPTFFLRLT